jgi:hypothetical protein
MWQFVSHHVMRPPLWTWRRLGRNGSVAQQSAGSFASYRKAYADAVRHGFKPDLEKHEKLDIQSEVESRKAKV